jgi:LysM domain-containing protein
MTTPSDAAAEPARAPERPGPVARSDDRDGPTVIDQICPYLVAVQGGWRSARPSRDHRCFAVDPPGPLPADKQRALCLTVEHATCPAFRAARASRAAMLAPGVDPAVIAAADATRRPIARSAPVVIEGPRLNIGGIGGGNWALSQALLVGLMVVAFAIVIVARLSTSDAPAPSASPLPPASASPTPGATPSRTPSPTVNPAGSGAVPGGSGGVPSAAASQAAAFRTTYRVKSGDTLVGIASTFSTSVAAIQELNGLKSSDLKIGELLKIP